VVAADREFYDFKNGGRNMNARCKACSVEVRRQKLAAHQAGTTQWEMNMDQAVEVTMKTIEQATRQFAEQQRDLRLLDALQGEIDDARRRAMKAIVRAVERTKTSHAALSALIERRPDLFVKPRKEDGE
jgi:type II secretory pathway component PulF